jgi:hypothetical protein
VKTRPGNEEREAAIREAKRAYLSNESGSIANTASLYGIPASTLKDRLRGALPMLVAHKEEQLRSEEEEKALVRIIERLDDWGHPLKVAYVNHFAKSLLPASMRRDVDNTGSLAS